MLMTEASNMGLFFQICFSSLKPESLLIAYILKTFNGSPAKMIVIVVAMVLYVPDKKNVLIAIWFL